MKFDFVIIKAIKIIQLYLTPFKGAKLHIGVIEKSAAVCHHTNVVDLIFEKDSTIKMLQIRLICSLTIQ